MKRSAILLIACFYFAAGISQVNAREWRVGHGTGYNLSDIEDSLKSQIQPGDTVLITAGTYDVNVHGNSLIVKGYKGKSDKPITIKGEFENARPILREGVNIENSHYIVLQNLEITRDTRGETAAAAVAVHGGSSYVRLSHLSVHNSRVGVSFGDPAPGNSIRYSHVFQNDDHGITSVISGDNKANNKPSSDADASVIEYNQVEKNGAHGIDLEASYWRVQRNRVLDNGHAYGGTSGIHLFREKDRNQDNPDCDNNEILYNYVSGQKDATLGDGNGIQIDHYCDNNLVAYNVVTNNDGAGISLVIGKNNTIALNTAYHNAVDKNRIARGAYRGEIILSSEEEVCPRVEGDCKPQEGVPVAENRSSGNKIYDNIAVSGQVDVPAIHVTEDFKKPGRNINYLYVNWYSSPVGGAPLRWGYESTWDIDGKTLPGNVFAPVTFKDAALNDSEGFRLLAFAPNDNLGWAPEQRRADMGQEFPLPAGQGKTSYWGAYYLCSTGACSGN
ncbi:MAG: right-handed parallel beta-helix repeat-containing protein [Proteobacteria bacterium]|nr:right-handed parallel beta-helix repeat-containing protein [Pseudomonadota bacterium]